jgi:hypothetical protein
MKLIGIFDPTKGWPVVKFPAATDGAARIMTNVGGVAEHGQIWFLCVDRYEDGKTATIWVEGPPSTIHPQDLLMRKKT